MFFKVSPIAATHGIEDPNSFMRRYLPCGFRFLFIHGNYTLGFLVVANMHQVAPDYQPSLIQPRQRARHCME